MTEPEQGYHSEDLEYLDMPPPQKGRLHEMILEDPVKRLDAPKPIVLKSGDPVSKALQLMKKFRFGSVLVVENEKLAGIFTEKDLLRTASGDDIDLDSITLKEVMTPNPQAVEDDDTLAHALHLMAIGRYRHVPILKEGKPTGFISIRGILRYISDNPVEPEA